MNKIDTTTNISQKSSITFKNTTQTITNLSKNEKVSNSGSMIKEDEVTGVWLLRNNKHQVTTPSRKEDDTNSTATVTTAAFTSDGELEWDDYITEGLAETTTLNDQVHVFGKRRWVKSSRKWRKPASQVCKEEKQSKLDTTSNPQARTINGVFFFAEQHIN